MKSKEKTFFRIFIIEILIAIVGICLFCIEARNSFADFNGFSMYRCIKSAPFCLSDIFMVITIILSMIAITNKFLSEINSGFFLHQKNYNKYITRSIIKIHFKSFLLQLINVVVLIFGIITLGDKLIVKDNNYLSGFYLEGIDKPYFYMIKVFIAGFFMINIIANLTLILNVKIKNNSLTYIATFITFNVLNLIVNMLFKQNMYYGYAPSTTGINQLILMYFIIEIITVFMVLKMYKNKEKLVLNYGK